MIQHDEGIWNTDKIIMFWATGIHTLFCGLPAKTGYLRCRNEIAVSSSMTSLEPLLNAFLSMFLGETDLNFPKKDSIWDTRVHQYFQNKTLISTTPLPQGSVGHCRWFHNQFPPFSSALHCPVGPGKLQACPFPDVVFPPLFLSALSFSSFHCALQHGSGPK